MGAYGQEYLVTWHDMCVWGGRGGGGRLGSSFILNICRKCVSLKIFTEVKPDFYLQYKIVQADVSIYFIILSI